MINFYDNIKLKKTINPNYKIHKIDIPFRGLVCCGSGGGKSNLVLNLLYLMNKTFHSIIICTKATEPLYDYLKDKINSIEIYYEGKIPEFEKMKEGENGLVIFDDLVLDNNKAIGEMFIRGRKLGYSMIFISQSFYQTSTLIRKNVNYIWLGRGLMKRDLNMILSEFALGMDKKELEKIYNELTKEPMNFMMIDFLKRNIRHNIIDIIKEF
jgi:hypothetical protein